MTLTKRQQAVLDMIAAYIKAHGFPPSRKDICNAMGFTSLQAAQQYVEVLAHKGAIELSPGVARGIRVLHRPGIDIDSVTATHT
jgi:repressor LexA